MSVIIQNNSILKSIGGEVYKQPPLIDLSSSYGVTKDGSNFVSSVKTRNKPTLIRALSTNKPIENGNGFEFSGSPLYPDLTLGDFGETIKHPWIFCRFKLTASGECSVISRYPFNSTPLYNKWMFIGFRAVFGNAIFNIGAVNGIGGLTFSWSTMPIINKEYRFVFMTVRGSVNPNLFFYTYGINDTKVFGETFIQYFQDVDDGYQNDAGQLNLGDFYGLNFSSSNALRSLKILNNIKIPPSYSVCKAIANNFLINNIDYDG